jgi:rhodanese-related sulfurtransferase
MKKIAVLFIAALCFSFAPAFAGTVGMMEIQELKQLLGSDDIVILDVRTGRDWSTSEFKIPEAIRATSNEFDTWGNQFPKDKKIVLYCA